MLVEFKGVPIEEIAKTMHHTCKTIQRYLSPDYSVEDGHYNARIPGKLAPYEAEVIKLRSEGMTYPNIHKIITEKGYKGSVASLRMFIQKERIRNEAHLSQQETCSDYQSKEYIQRRSLIQLIYKGFCVYSILFCLWCIHILNGKIKVNLDIICDKAHFKFIRA